MIFSRDYRRPFWRGFIHSVFVVMYCLFITTVILSLNVLYQGEIGAVIQMTLALFITVLSVAVCAYLIFYEPMQYIMHSRAKAGQVMMISTLGWLIIFLIIFLLGLVWSSGYYPLQGVGFILK